VVGSGKAPGAYLPVEFWLPCHLLHIRTATIAGAGSLAWRNPALWRGEYNAAMEKAEKGHRRQTGLEPIRNPQSQLIFRFQTSSCWVCCVKINAVLSFMQESRAAGVVAALPKR